MKLSTWRPSLLVFIPKVIKVDTWDLDRAELGLASGFIPPLRETNFQLSDSYEVQASAVQDVQVQLRFPDNLKYSQLPVAALEGAYQTFAFYMATFYQAVNAELTALTVEQSRVPVMIEEVGDRRGEWLATLSWSFNLAWLATPEPNLLSPVEPPPVPGYEVKSINAGVWRSHLSKNRPPVLDFRLLLTRQTP